VQRNAVPSKVTETTDTRIRIHTRIRIRNHIQALVFVLAVASLCAEFYSSAVHDQSLWLTDVCRGYGVGFT
jgi:hypothetical protein